MCNWSLRCKLVRACPTSLTPRPLRARICGGLTPGRWYTVMSVTGVSRSAWRPDSGDVTSLWNWLTGHVMGYSARHTVGNDVELRMQGLPDVFMR